MTEELNPYQPSEVPAVRSEGNGHYAQRGFLTEPELIDTGETFHGRRIYELSAPLKFVACDRPEYVNIVSVPRGFKTDLATIPAFLWWIYPPDGPWKNAAIVHDFLCGQRFNGTPTIPEVDRHHADSMLRVAMGMIRDVRPGSKIAFYWAVRIYGIASAFVSWLLQGKK